MLGFLSAIPGVNIISGVWSVATSRLGLAVIAFLAGWYFGFTRADRAADVAALQNQVKALQIDINIARQGEALATQQVVTLEGIASENQGKIDALLADLAKRPGRDVCRLSERDAQRLRDIR